MTLRHPRIAAGLLLASLSAAAVAAGEPTGDGVSRPLDVYAASARDFAAAVAAHRRGQLQAAADRYAAALEKDPTFVEALVNLARIDLERGDLDAAGQRLARAVSLRPEYPGLYRVRGLLALRSARADLAIQDLSYARKLSPDDAEVLTNLGAALLERGRLVDAEKVLFLALRREPDDPSALLNLALAQDRAGQPLHAAFHYRRFLDVSETGDPARAVVRERLRELATHPPEAPSEPRADPPSFAATKPGARGGERDE
jgi:Flp pilus assembly protein TadD